MAVKAKTGLSGTVRKEPVPKLTRQVMAHAANQTMAVSYGAGKVSR
jgi:hypothetical protein